MKSSAEPEREDKSRDRSKLDLYHPRARSRVTNGHDLLPDVDHRTQWCRRFRDVLSLHLSDLGGASNTSEAEKAILRRPACLIFELHNPTFKFPRPEQKKTWQLHR